MSDINPDRLCDRPWRIMAWVYPTDGPKYAVCVDAFPTLVEAWDALDERPGAWVEGEPKSSDPVPPVVS